MESIFTKSNRTSECFAYVAAAAVAAEAAEEFCACKTLTKYGSEVKTHSKNQTLNIANSNIKQASKWKKNRRSKTLRWTMKTVDYDEK